MVSIVSIIISSLTLLVSVYRICATAHKIAELKYKTPDKEVLNALQQELDEVYKKEPQLTVDGVMEILNEEYGYEEERHTDERPE